MHSFSAERDTTFFTLTARQEEFHTGRLLCWSGALVAITLWGSAQFFDKQNLRWHQQHKQEEQRHIGMNEGQMALPETQAILRRFAISQHQNEAPIR